MNSISSATSHANPASGAANRQSQGSAASTCRVRQARRGEIKFRSRHRRLTNPRPVRYSLPDGRDQAGQSLPIRIENDPLLT